MPIKITNILKNYELLTSNNDNYYENELFTKFEDAFIYAAGKGIDDIKIIHGSRSMIRFPTGAGKECELADLRCIFYSIKQNEYRLLFLQFKREKYASPKPFVVKIDEKQYELYNTHPDVFPKSRKITIPNDILKDKIHGCNDAGTMFALIKADGHGGYPLLFANAKKLHLKGKNKYECMGGTSVIKKTVPGFTYCEYAPDLEEFLKQAKDMNVGREIDITTLALLLGKSVMTAPAGLKAVIASAGIPGITMDEEGSPKHFAAVNTMFINVDELE